MATETKEQKNGTTELAKEAPAKTARVTTKVLEQVNNLRSKGLGLPADYSAANALNSAWLALQEVQNMDRKPIIANGQLTGVVTELSVVNALHDMVIQGLNPTKKQCYFIVYGQKVICQRSYFGDMLLAQRVKPGIEFYYDTINEGDEIQVEKVRTSKGMVTTVTKHVQKFPRSEALIGAYCGIIDADGNDLGADVFDMLRIRKSWAMSKIQKVQNEYPAEMALRTVIRHRCKPIINASNDAMLAQSMARQEVEQVDAEIMEEASANANAEALPIEATIVDQTTGEVKEQEKTELF